jgi:hypothetical protein
MSRSTLWGILIISYSLIALSPSYLEARKRIGMIGTKDLATNIITNRKAQFKYEYQRLTRYYLYNDGYLDPQEKEILQLLAKKWQINPEEVEEIIQEAKKSIE